MYVGDAGFPASNNEHRFVRADADAISASAHAFVSADNNCIERAVVAMVITNLVKLQMLQD